jgi:CBS domain-containing protein
MAIGFKNVPDVLCAADVMTTKLVTLSPEQDVFQAVALLVKHKISGAPVVDTDGRLMGMFTERCCLEVLLDATYRSLPSSEVGSFMIEDPISIEQNMTLFSVAQMFISQPIRRLPVLRDGTLIGQISRRDVIRHAAKLIKPVNNRGSATLYLSALANTSNPTV